MTKTHQRSHTPEWYAWCGMRQRCMNANTKAFKDYGGRGIKVADEWLDFERFFADVGAKPGPDYSLERIDNNGPYAPGNVRWATRLEQAQNKRNNRHITANGMTKSMAEWARDLGCNPAAILARIGAGMSPQAAVTTPIPERPNAKLTAEQARQIFRCKGKTSAQRLADQYDVCKKSVLNIFHRRTFADATS